MEYAYAFWTGWIKFLFYGRKAMNHFPKRSPLWCAFETGWERIAWEFRTV